MAEKELAVFDAHITVEAVILSRGIMTERCRCNLRPFLIGRTNPLITKSRLAQKMAVLTAEGTL